MIAASTTDAPTDDRAPRRDWPKVMPWLLALVGVLCYVNTLANEFVFDDTALMVREQLQDLSDPWTIISQGRRPVVDLTFAVNLALDENSPVWYHLFNLAIHIAAGVTLYDLVRRTLRLSSWGPWVRDSVPWLAGAVALLWLVHPLNTQAVTYVIQRYESMMGLFFLLTLYGVVRWAEAPQKRWWAVVAVAACALGMASKEVMATAPVVALLLDRAFLAGSFGEALRRRWPVYVGLVATWALLPLMGLGDVVAEGGSAGFGMEARTPLVYLLSQGEVILHYLRLSFWPHPLVLDYAWPPAFPDGPWLLPVIAGGGLVVLTLVGLWLNRWWGFLGAWFFLILGPTSSVVPIADLAVEHRMYLPLIAVVAVVVFGGFALLRRVAAAAVRPVVGGALVVVAAGALAATTVARNFEYQTAVGLWQTVVERAPANPRAYYNLGGAYHAGNYYHQALAAYTKALLMLPPHAHIAADAHNNLGTIWMEVGELDDALRQFETALAARPDDPEFHYNYGRALFFSGELDAAQQHLERAIELRPDYAKAHNNLAVVRIQQGDPAEGERLLREAIRLDPELADAHQSLGTLMLNTGRPGQAINYYQAALRHAGPSPVVLTSLGSAYARVGRLTEAQQALREAIRLEPRHLPAYPALGLVLLEQGDPVAAAQAFAAALQLQPNLPDIAAELALILSTHPHRRIRDGQRAWSVLEPFADLQDKSPLLAQAFAAAHAELGRTEEAAALQAQAVEAAVAAGADEQTLQLMRDRLAAYEAGNAYRDPRWPELDPMGFGLPPMP